MRRVLRREPAHMKHSGIHIVSPVYGEKKKVSSKDNLMASTQDNA
jgi:hypothetical protein